MSQSFPVTKRSGVLLQEHDILAIANNFIYPQYFRRAPATSAEFRNHQMPYVGLALTCL